jgi:hypothetical protein
MISTLCQKIKPADIIALVVIIGCFILKVFGSDGVISTILTCVVMYYFGVKVQYDNIKTP